MKSYHYLILFVLIVLCGCTPSRRPKDLPKLYPCEITVTQKGTPLAEAVVQLVPTETNQKYASAATTGPDGKVVMSTYGFPGVPVGKYKVVVIKNHEDDIVYKTDESGEKVIVSSNTYRMVETAYSNAKTTPLELEITGKGPKIEKTLEVGEPIRVKI